MRTSQHFLSCWYVEVKKYGTKYLEIIAVDKELELHLASYSINVVY